MEAALTSFTSNVSCIVIRQLWIRRCKIICCSPSPVFCCSRVWTISVSSCLLLLRHGNRPSPPCTSCTIRCGNRPLVVVAYISHTLVSKADLSHVLVDIVVGVLTSSRLVYIPIKGNGEKQFSVPHIQSFQTCASAVLVCPALYPFYL